MIANVNPEFRFNEQQDAAEILQVLLNEFTVHSVTSHNLITFRVGKRITCNQCMTEYLSEECGNILKVTCFQFYPILFEWLASVRAAN